MSDVIEITGTIRAPFLPVTTDGHPRLSVDVKNANGEDLTGFSAQVTGLSLPFRIFLDRASMTDQTLISVQATCETSTGSNVVVARLERTMSLAQATGAPVELELQAQPDVACDQQTAPVQMNLVELSGQVIVPPELRHEGAFIGTALYVEQENGESNLYSSNLTEHGMTHSGNGAAFTLFVDPATIPEGRPVNLSVIFYDREENTLLATASVPHLDLESPSDLSALELTASA
nr:hypothetical protein [uncultured Pseudomonas sp.]